MDNNRELEKKIQILGDAQKSLYSFTENIFSKSFTNFIGGQYVEQSCIELQKYDRTMRLAFRSGFKCLKIGTQIWFANGNRKRIQEVQPGDLILGYKKGKLVKNKVKKAQAVGYKILKKIETSFGNTIYSSKEHKFLTDKGWKKAKDLQIDDFLLVSNKELTKGKEKLVSDEDAILLAYLIGDGCTVDLCQMGFTSSSDKRMREFVGIVNKKGWKTRIIKNTENFKEVRVTGVGISNYLRKYNLARKKSIEKGIPSEIMNSCSTTIALFLNRLWSCDGTIRLNVNTGSILYTTASFQLAKDVQYLLLSLGIPNIFRKRTTKLWNGTLYTYWIIYVSRARWQKLFLEKIGLIFSKEEKSQEIKIGLKERCYKGMTKKIPFALVNFIPKYKLEREGCDCISAKRLKSICPKTELHKLQEILNSDTVWSKIVNIENSKIEATYDIETEIGNYIAEGIVVHNSTSFYSKIMRDIMFRGIKEDLDIRYFSYKEELAGWHIGNIKSLISKNPYFTEIINMKSSAENVAQYTWDRKHLINIRPVGIVSASRGLKASSIYCVHPDTKILSSDGYKPIKTLKVGQKVLTHIGKFKEIKKVYKRKVNEEIIKLTIQDSDELLLTKNHKVLVYETKRHNRGQICTPECSFHGEKLEKKAKLHTGKKKIGPKARYTIKNNPPLYLDYKPKWKEAGKLTYNDYILFPEKLEKLKDNCYIFDRVNKRKRLESQEIRKDYLKTYEFWKFIGYFLADGHASDNNITISLNRSEKEFIADCFTIIKSLGFIPHIYNPKGTNVTTVIICNSQFSRFLKNNFYDGKFKILPSENIPKKFVSVLLQGFISGDGYISKSGIRITSISIGLLKQLQRLMLEIQIRSNIYKMKTSDTIMGRKLLSFEPKFELRIPVSDYKKLGYLTNQKIQKPKTFFFNSFSARRLKKIEKVNYNGDVYNLEVDENHSYLSHLITLKNCDDILSDPANPIHPTIILKINSLFKSVILESLKPGGEIHIIGCVSKDTRILTAKGLEKIGDLDMPKKSDTYRKLLLRVYGIDGFHATSHSYNKGLSKIKRITTKSGYELECSLEHPIMVMDKNGKRVWKDAKKLSIGDWVGIQKNQQEFGFDETLSEDEAYLMGLWIAEGSKDGNNGKVQRLSIYNSDIEIRDFLKKMGWIVNSQRFDVHRKSDVKLINRWKKLGVNFVKSYKKTIPEIIFKSRKKIVVKFLQGLFDGDGSNTTRGIILSSTSKKMIQEVQIILLLFGIVGNIYKSKPGINLEKGIIGTHFCYNLVMDTYDYNKFLEEISFGLKRKQVVKRKRTIVGGHKIPYQGKLLKNVLIKNPGGKITNIVNENSFACEETLEEAISNTYNVKFNESYCELKNNLKYFWNQIKKIEEDKKEVVDFVIPETHSFFTNGFVSHNSPLSQADIYFDPAIQKEFHTTFNPAIQKDNDGNEISTWPEFYTLEKLKKKVFVMGEKAFQSEMMMEPYYSTDSYFKKENLRKDVVNPKLKNIRLVEGFGTPNLVVAGLDIGKKKHVSALEIFEIKDGKAIQIHRKIMKGWKYYSGKKFDPFNPTQVEYCKEAIKNFGIGYIYYDNTRGEFEGANDSGLLSIHFVPIVFTSKMRVQMATDFEKAVMNKQLEIFDDEDMLNSICSVTNELISIETSSGTHGDEFWAVALALIGHSKFGEGGINDKKIRVGSKNIFGGRIPKGW